MVDPKFYDLLKFLGNGGSFQHYWTPDGDDDRKISRWFATGESIEVPKPWLSRNVYFSVNPSSVKRGQFQKIHNDDVEVVNAIYVEYDCKTEKEKAHRLAQIRRWLIQPAVIIDSGGGLHVYVLLCEPFRIANNDDRKKIATIQRAWVHYMDGDTTVHDLARVLRVPGTKNFKPDYAPNFPTVEILDFDLSIQHKLSRIEAAVQPLIDKWAKAAQKAHTNGQGKSNATVSLDDQAVLDKMFAGKNGNVLQRLYGGDYSMYLGNDGKPDHSKGDASFASALAYYTGCDPVQMQRIFETSGLIRDKWRDRKDYREKTINNAINTSQKMYDGVASGGVPAGVQAARTMVGMNSSMPNASSPVSLLDFEISDQGNAEAVLYLCQNKFVSTTSHGWLVWTGTHWSNQDADAYLHDAIVHTLRERRKAAVQANSQSYEHLISFCKPNRVRISATVYVLEKLARQSVEIFDSNPELLNCQNGVVNLRTGQLEPHDPAQHFTYCVPVNYNPRADYIDWSEFLFQITGSQIMCDYLQMATGYSATGDTREECLFYVYGPTRSGKGTFVETLLALLPKPLGVQADFATFTAKRDGDMQNFDLAPLKPARFIAASESSKYDTLNEAKIKTATGGDWIRCSFKHKDHFEYRPQFKIWLVSNHPVSGDVDDDAFWGRLRVILFPHSFLGKEDKNLKRRMRSAKNLEGVLCWLVEGAMAWYAAKDGLPIPAEVKTATQYARTELDHVQQWLDECCDADPSTNSWTITAEVYKSYKEYCGVNGINEKGIRHFGRALSAKGYDVGVRKTLQNGKRARGIQGITII